MSYGASQIIRASNLKTDNNPSGFVNDIMRLHTILVNNTPPIPTSGLDGDYFIDNNTQNFYGPKTRGLWGPPIYNFSGVVPGTGIISVTNVGDGVGWFKQIIGTNAEFKTLLSNTDQITISVDVDDIMVSMNPTYKPASLSRVDNYPLQTGLGSAPLSPNGVLGTVHGYINGSLFIQVPSNTLWGCKNADLNQWEIIYSPTLSLSAVDNAILGGYHIYKNTVNGVALLNVLIGTVNEILISDVNPNELVLYMSPSYVPPLLNKIVNIKDNRSAPPSAPTINNDANEGYQKGSLWVEQEPAGLGKLWVCNNAAVGAAEWTQIGGATTITDKGYVTFNKQPLTSNTFPNNNFVQCNFGVAPFTHIEGGPDIWTSVYSGQTTIFRRGITSKLKSYKVDITFYVDIVPAILDVVYEYEISLFQNPSNVFQAASQLYLGFNGSSSSFRYISASTSFIIKSLTTGTDEYYFQIKRNGGVAPDITYRDVKISFVEL